MMKTRIARLQAALFTKSGYYMVFALLFMLIFRFVSLQLLDDSGDSKYYMEHVKQLLSGTEPYEFNHWSARFAVILPVALVRVLTGGAAIGAYILPVLFSLIAAFLVIKIARLMDNEEAGFIAVILLAVYPGMIRSGSQILPGIFSMVYLLAALYFILFFVFKKPRVGFVILAAVFVFLGYETHIINLFFVPGFALIILLNMEEEKSCKAIALFCGVLFALFVAETMCYHFFTEFPLGRLDVIRGSHLSENQSLRPAAVWELFFRFVRPGPVFVIFFVLSLWYAVKCVLKKDRIIISLYLPVCVFFIIMLLALKSLVPLVPALPFNARYLDVSVPFIILFGSFFITSFLNGGLSKDKQKRLFSIAGCIILIAAVFIFRSNVIHHPLINMNRADIVIDKTITAGIPLVYSREDSDNFNRSKELGLDKKREPGMKDRDFETAEEYVRINKNIDYINAFFADADISLVPKIAVMPDRTKVLLCVRRELAPEYDWNEYLTKPQNPLLLTRRRPLALDEITVADYPE